jgi:hypothetical protein
MAVAVLQTQASCMMEHQISDLHCYSSNSNEQMRLIATTCVLWQHPHVTPPLPPSLLCLLLTKRSVLDAIASLICSSRSSNIACRRWQRLRGLHRGPNLCSSKAAVGVVLLKQLGLDCQARSIVIWGNN